MSDHNRKDVCNVPNCKCLEDAQNAPARIWASRLLVISNYDRMSDFHAHLSTVKLYHDDFEYVRADLARVSTGNQMMSDLISAREDLEAAVKLCKQLDNHNWNTAHHLLDRIALHVSQALRSLPTAGPEDATCEWVDASVSVPTHIYTVVIWVVGGPLHCNEDYLDVGCYNEKRGKWQSTGHDSNDIDVEVSHWFSPTWHPNKPAHSVGRKSNES